MDAWGLLVSKNLFFQIFYLAMFECIFTWQAEELDQDQDQNWIIDPKNIEVLNHESVGSKTDPKILNIRIERIKNF